MLCPFPVRWGDEGKKPQLLCKQPGETINIKYLGYLVRLGKKYKLARMMTNPIKI
jgi:hypothetical protein